MQADAIPDWAIYIVLMPFVPTSGFIHPWLGTIQWGLVLVASAVRFYRNWKNPRRKASWLWTVYLPLLLLPNIAVVVWGMWTDPAL